MPQLDRLIQLLHERHADALALVAGQPASLQARGRSQPVTQKPVTQPQLLALVREIAPAEAAERVDGTDPWTFRYDAPAGAVTVDLSWATDGHVVLIRPQGNGAPARVAVDDTSRRRMEDLLRRLVEGGGSDLHLRTGEPPIIRTHGDLAREAGSALAAGELEAMLAAIMSPRDAAAYRDTSDVDWAYEIPELARFRCNAGRDRVGPFAVFRVIPSRVPDAGELGLSREVQNLCALTRGLVLVTGPTGSGKSTTLAAMVDLVNRTRADHILTIEDPIEFVHPSRRCVVTQRQVGLHSASFKQALRAALREDPDVVLVGEMRDLETVSIAIETAETGHLVFGTLHTTTAASTVDRIIDQFPPDRQAQIRIMLSESLRGVIAQTLCRKKGGGRVAAREILLSIPAIANLIREGKTFQIPSIMQTNRKTGMVTLNDALLELVDAGLVEPQEAWIRSMEKAGFAAALKARRHDTSFLAEGA